MNCKESECCSLRKKFPSAGMCKIEWAYDSWTEKFGYYCEKSFFRTGGKTMVLLISTILCFILLYSADSIGRRTVVKISSAVIIIGCVITYIVPDLLLKMISIGFAAGAEGAFSALFTMLINESTLPSTKLRSTLISGCFLAYGLGCIAINASTFYIEKAQWLTLASSILVIITVIPSFVSYFESPQWLVGKGKFTEAMKTFAGIKMKNKLIKNQSSVQETQKEFIQLAFKNSPQQEFDIEVINCLHKGNWIELKNLVEQEGTSSSSGQRDSKLSQSTQISVGTGNGGSRITNDGGWIISLSKEGFGGYEKKASKEYTEAAKQMFTDKTYLCQFICMSLISSLLYMLFYGMTTSVQELGLKSIQLNGILLGVSQSLGYSFILPFTHKLPRKKFSNLFQSIIMISSIILLLIGIFMEQNEIRKWLESLISTILISTLTSMMFPLLFLWIAELFPTKIRGLASAVILFLGKLLGGLAPILSEICEMYGIHVLVGCSAIGIFSLIGTNYLNETYNPLAKDQKKYSIQPIKNRSVFSIKAPLGITKKPNIRKKPIDLDMKEYYDGQEDSEQEGDADFIF